MLEAAAGMLEQIPHVDKKLEQTVVSICNELRQERNRMIPIMDQAHEAAGTPRT